MTPPRVRFAPSPTGQLHVGNARTALFNWLFARRHGGAFILRIEDTDSERSTRAAEAAQIEDLQWLRFAWDEGPDIGGPHGPYRQSDRLARYASLSRDLLARGHAYWCFCSVAELEAERQAALASGQPPKYSGRCRLLDPDESAARVARGETAALRFKVPVNREVVVHDLIRGDVVFHTDVIGDPVIVRSEGLPAYNFAVVADDAGMAITHVIRGEDHLSNTPRQVLLYEAIGASPPLFAHLAMVLGPDHTRLSKRHGATSVADFREHGYLPEALVNYLALLGWSPGEGEEILPVDELVRRFELERVSHSAAVFDPGKLAWMSRHYIRERSASTLVREVWPYLARRGFVGAETTASAAYVEALLPMAAGSVDRLEDVPDRLGFVFDWDASRAAELLAVEPGGAAAVRAFAGAIDGALLTDKEAFRSAAARARERTGLKGRALFHPIRVAMTAAESGPELDLAVPAIDRGAALEAASGVRRIASCAERARVVAERLT